MAIYKWSASSSGSASTTTNWTPNGTPATGDTVQYSSLSVADCDWDIAVIGIIDVGSDYTGAIEFQVDTEIETGLSIASENNIHAASGITLSFTGTPAYSSGKSYVKLNCTDPFRNSTSRNNFLFKFAGSAVLELDSGIYPHLEFASGFRPNYFAPTLSSNKYYVKFLSMKLTGGSVAQLANPTSDDRKMHFVFEGMTGFGGSGSQFQISSVSPSTFDGGYAHWTFQCTASGFTIPVSGTPLYNDWTFTFRNMIIDSTANGSGGFTGIVHGAILSLINLTINEGASIKGSDSSGATIHLVNRPTINGTWGFLPIADGIYHYKGLFNLGVYSGGTGLTSVTQGQVLFGNTSQALDSNAGLSFSSADSQLTVGTGNAKGIIITAGTDSSPASNQLWVNSADSNKLYFGSSAVGSGGGGGGTMTFTLAGDSGASQTIADTNTMTIAGGTGLSSVASATDTITLNLDNTTVTAGSYTNANITVDAQGRLTAAANGSGGSGMTSWTLSGDSGSNQTIADGNTVDIAGGTGISTAASATDTLTVTNTGVTSNVAGTGIGVSAGTGAVTISNTGVTENVAGMNIAVSGATGSVTVSAPFPEHGVGAPPVPAFAQTPDDAGLGYVPYGWVEIVTVSGVNVFVPAWIQA